MNDVRKSQSNRHIYLQKQQCNPGFLEDTRRSRLWSILGLIVLVLAIVRAALATPPTGSTVRLAPPALPSHVAEQLLVKPKSHVSEAELQGLIRNHGAMEVGAIRQINVRVLHVPEERLSTVLSALKSDPNIEFAEPDYILEPALIPNDTYYPLEWHLPKISAPSAWDIVTGTTNVIIAILDSGVDSTHPDLCVANY